jgi:hypothetical protein
VTHCGGHTEEIKACDQRSIARRRIDHAHRDRARDIVATLGVEIHNPGVLDMLDAHGA